MYARMMIFGGCAETAKPQVTIEYVLNEGV